MNGLEIAVVFLSVAVVVLTISVVILALREDQTSVDRLTEDLKKSEEKLKTTIQQLGE
jgi:biotin operon repressor